MFTEATAASGAGLNAVLVARSGNASLTDEQKKLFPVIDSFKDLPLNEVTDAVDGEVSGKRKLDVAEVNEVHKKRLIS